ncbi:CbiX/SirB N-terminal domain-containing protein [Staphylococcus sp. KG4-1]|nr:CbiX/SirB N-terminal domain-containing protein [Staphylococcus sp. KG4-1]
MAENILVIHGMRKGKQNNIIYEFVKQLMMSKHRHVYIAFLECETRNLKVVMSNLIRQGYFEFNIIASVVVSGKTLFT